MNLEGPDNPDNQENKQINTDTAKADTADPIDLVNQQLEQQPTIDPEEVVNNPAITPEMLNEGDSLRGDLTRE